MKKYKIYQYKIYQVNLHECKYTKLFFVFMPVQRISTLYRKYNTNKHTLY